MMSRRSSITIIADSENLDACLRGLRAWRNANRKVFARDPFIFDHVQYLDAIMEQRLR
jgi:hypothetical protein